MPYSELGEGVVVLRPGVGPGRAARHLGAGGGAESLNCTGHSSMFTQFSVVLILSSENDKPS